MARTKGATKRTTIEKGAGYLSLGLRFDERVLEIMHQEAEWASMSSVAKFVRRLIVDFVASSTLERAAGAPPRTPLSTAQEPVLRTINFRVPTKESKILLELCNRLGGASKSTILSHLVLDWCGISPLSPGFVFDAQPPRRATKTAVVTSKLSKDVYRLLEIEGELLSLSASDLLQQILNGVIGLSTVRRSPKAPPLKPLRNGQHDKATSDVRWTQQHAEFITDVCRMLGGGERATVLTHFVLDWMGISPLRHRGLLRGGSTYV